MAENAQRKTATNGFAIASLITGIIPFLGLLGVIFGFVSLSQIKKSHEGGKGMAIAGIILGFAQMVFGIVYMIFVFWIFNTAVGIIESPIYSNELINGLEDLNNIQFNFQ